MIWKRHLTASRVRGNLQINPPFFYFLPVSVFVLHDCAGLKHSVLLCQSVTLICLFVIIQWTRSGSLQVTLVVGKVIFRSIPWSCLLHGTVKVAWEEFCRMVLPLSRKVCGIPLRKTCILPDSPPLKSRTGKINSSLLMEKCGVSSRRFQQFYMVEMLKLFPVIWQNGTAMKKQLLLPGVWCFKPNWVEPLFKVF